MPTAAYDDLMPMIRGVVEPAGLSEFELRDLESWLVGKVTEYHSEVNLLAKFGHLAAFNLGSHRQAARACQRLLDAASVLGEGLEGLVLRPSLEDKLFDAYVTLGTAPNAKPDFPRHSKKWEASKARMVKDLDDLQRVAGRALADLDRGGRTGRPPQSWRDAAFYSLFERLHAAGSKRSKEATVDLALRVWEIYSPDASTAIMTEDAAGLIVKMRGKGRGTTKSALRA